MREEYIEIIKKNGLSPFNKLKTPISAGQQTIYKTRDGKSVHNKFLSKISSNFIFSETSNLWNAHFLTSDYGEILKRQNFFKNNDYFETDYLSKLKKPKQIWSPEYDIIATTENEDTFVKLREIGCSTKFISSEYDLNDLERYDIIQVIDCENFERALERLPQTISINNIEDVYLERYLELLSGWMDNLKILEENSKNEEIIKIVRDLEPLLSFFNDKSSKKFSVSEITQIAEDINEKIEEKIKDMSVSGLTLMKMLNEGKMPPEFQKIISETISESKAPGYLFEETIPVTVDEKAADDFVRKQDLNEFSDMAERVKSNAKLLKEVPSKLDRLSELILIEDFLGGTYKYLKDTTGMPSESENMQIISSKNYFLGDPQPISFNLSGEIKCSILTGANSGGKTTLLEHIIQIISAFQTGLSTNGDISMPLFEEVYYFAKNKGATNKGAFENLLTQMSEIKPGKKTLILADEIEAVTEPGVAGKIIASTAKYFLSKGCLLIIATHLGHEIKEILPDGARIDGIEATGLDADFNLIVNHNPVIGKLANSTPELIVEKMTNTSNKEYFKYIFEHLKS